MLSPSVNWDMSKYFLKADECISHFFVIAKMPKPVFSGLFLFLLVTKSTQIRVCYSTQLNNKKQKNKQNKQTNKKQQTKTFDKFNN